MGGRCSKEGGGGGGSGSMCGKGVWKRGEMQGGSGGRGEKGVGQQVWDRIIYVSRTHDIGRFCKKSQNITTDLFYQNKLGLHLRLKII